MGKIVETCSELVWSSFLPKHVPTLWLQFDCWLSKATALQNGDSLIGAMQKFYDTKQQLKESVPYAPQKRAKHDADSVAESK